MENYFDAAFTFVDRGTFAEDPEQAAAGDLVTQESVAQKDWFEKVETILTQLELADNPQSIVVSGRNTASFARSQLVTSPSTARRSTAG